MASIRLDKYLADAGIGTRSQVKQYIKKGLVTVNQTISKSPDMKIDTASDIITYAGAPVLRETYVYYMLNKPAGYISATEDSHEQTVMELIHDSTHKDLFPVGRLDKDTEGLLLITNDGELAHQLLSPRKHVDKVYYVETDLPIPQHAIELFRNGIDIGEKQNTLPAELSIITDTTANITIREGKFHQVKRMFLAVGCNVTYLRRLQMGPLTLDEALTPGSFRRLSEKEICALHHANALTQ